MLPQTVKLAAMKTATTTSARVISSAIAVPVFKRSPGDSFSSFKEYRENAKTYGPLSASLAAKRHLTQISRV